MSTNINPKETHVILISADQLRYDVTGKGFTPNIDALAAESLRYCNAYCASPLCVPARGSLFTGLCPNSTGSLINPWEEEDAESGYVREGIDNLYDIMVRNGRDCLHSGKQHLFTAGEKLENRPDTPIHWLSTDKTYRTYLKEHGKRMPGGSLFRSPVPEMRSRKETFLTTCSNAYTGCYEEGEAYYYDSYFTAELLEGLRKRDESKPLFLSAMFLAPHPPFDIPEPWYSMVPDEDVHLPENVGIFYPRQSPLQLYNVTGVLGSHYTRKEWSESWRVYLGLVSLLDHCIGQIISELKVQGIYEDSLILFTSDHGEMLGSHGLFQKMCMYQESVKVPLSIRLPHSSSGRDIYENVSHIDILPSLCHYLRMTSTHSPEGRILPGLSKEPYCRPTIPLFIQYDGNGSLSGYQRCIICNNMKLIMDVFKEEVYFELYDIVKDTEEKDNLMFHAAESEKAIPLFSQLLTHMHTTGDALSCSEHTLSDFLNRCRKSMTPSSY